MSPSLSKGSVQGGITNAQITAATTMQAPVRASGGKAVGSRAARITDTAYAIIATKAKRKPTSEMAGMPPSPRIASVTPPTETRIASHAYSGSCSLRWMRS